jgi:hypothetical protein
MGDNEPVVVGYGPGPMTMTPVGFEPTTTLSQPRQDSDLSVVGKVGAPPSHYSNPDGVDPFRVIDVYGLTFFEGSALKYLARWNKKGDPGRDLAQAEHLLQECLNRTPRNVKEFLDLPLELSPDKVAEIWGLEGFLYDAVVQLLLSKTTAYPRTYVRAALAEVQDAL